MKKVLLSLSFAFCFLSAFTQTVYEQCIDGRVYVKFDKTSIKDLTLEDPRNITLSKFTVIRDLISKYGITKAYKPFYQASDDDRLPYVIKLEFSKIGLVESLIDDLKKINGVEYAEKVSLNKTHAVPNDPMFATSGGSVHLNQINAQAAWNIFNSTANGTSTVMLAVVDNAVMWTHTDLAGNTYTNTGEIANNSIDDDGNGYVDDRNGYDVADLDNNTVHSSTSFDHGTHCAGIAAASTDNNTGVASIGWNIKMIPVKCEPNSSTQTLWVTYGYEGILYAVKAKARIISCSWGNNLGALVTEQYVIDYAWARGCLVIASAGNLSSSTPNYPGAYNHVYCVASVNQFDTKSSFSNFGSWVDICAPGENIMSTLPYTSSAAYGQYSGTSQATPIVAGLAALMLSKIPYLTNADILNCISSTAVNIYTVTGNSSYITGSQLGAGRIDAFAAMSCAAGYSVALPIANFYAFPPKTCPNTPINFYDSSLYVPVTWNWVFQGGSPATSTLANPTVSWTTPGTYSVSLTVTNVNGSNAKTKLAYITVSGPASLPFFEGFENTPFLPPGWYANNIGFDNIYWARKTPLGAYGTSTACAMFNNFILNAPGDRDEMRTPGFDFSNVASARLRFDVAYARYNPFIFDSLEVKVSVNCGLTWSQIYVKGSSALATAPDVTNQFVPASNEWRRDTIDISIPAAGQGNVMFSFVNRGHYGQAIYLDNINLAFPTPTMNAAHASTICVNSPYSFTNTSISAASYTWNFPGGSPATSTSSNPIVSYASTGTYTVMMLGINGTSSATAIHTINVTTPPSVSIGSSASGTICAGESVTLTASGAPAYQWAGGLANSVYVVNPSTSTIYTVTGSIDGCGMTSTIGVSIGPAPFSVSISATAFSLCNGSSSTLTANGASTYSWSGGTSGSSNAVVVAPASTTGYSVTGFVGSCPVTAYTTVTVIPIPFSTPSSTNSTCNGQCNGMVNATTTGAGPFSYSLNTGACPSLPCTNLCAGVYTLTTSDSGCMSTSTFTVTSPSAITAVLGSTVAGCSNCPDGALSVTPAGGLAPYTYTWIPSGGNAAFATGLTPQCYTVNIGDANNCVVSQSACVDFVGGVNTLQMNLEIKLYPNPTNGNITLEGPVTGFTYTVYNNLGQHIANGNSAGKPVLIDLNRVAKGIYYVEIKGQAVSAREKLLVE